MSLKVENVGGQEHARLLLRLKTGTIHDLISSSTTTNPVALAKLLNDQLSIEHLTPVVCPRASQLIAAYDEHVLVSQFKFGVLYQRFGQTKEEQLFGNLSTSPALDEFLNILGQRILLKDHKGYLFLNFILNYNSI